MNLHEAVDEALADGDIDRAAALAAQFISPTEHLRAMRRIHAHTKQHHTTKGNAPMFGFANQPAQMSFNTFTEKHGDDPVPAASCAFRLNLPSTVLDLLSPALRAMFYYKQGHDEPGHIPNLADQVHDAPNLRAGAKLRGPFPWFVRWAGYQIRFHIGTSEKSHLLLTDCEIDKIKFDPQEGGTVLVQFTAIFHPDEKLAGKLYSMNNRQWDITLAAPDGAREVKPKTAEQEQQPQAPTQQAELVN